MSSSVYVPGFCRKPPTPVFSRSAIFSFGLCALGTQPDFQPPPSFYFFAASDIRVPRSTGSGFVPLLEFFVEVPISVQAARSWVLLPPPVLSSAASFVRFGH
jgi:hypothetical protein